MSSPDDLRSDRELAPDARELEAGATSFTAPLHCTTCGNDLHGLPTHEVCPFCRTPIEVSRSAFEQPGEIAQAGCGEDFPYCARCGYDLAGLDDDGACPECGAPISMSRSGALLRSASPEYLKALHLGAFLAPTSILMIIAGALASFVVTIIAGSLQSTSLGVLADVFQLLIPGGAIGWVVGWWKFSSKDPMFAELEETSSARKWSRRFLVGFAILMGVSFGLLYQPQALGAQYYKTSGYGRTLAGTFTFVGSMVMLLLQYIYSMLYIRWLALRIPRRTIAHWAKMLTWLGPLIYIVGSIAIIGPLISLGFYWSLLDQMRQELKAIRRGNEAGIYTCRTPPSQATS